MIVYSLKTSLLKWRPDYDIAAEEYNQAGKTMVSYLGEQHSLRVIC